MVSRAAATAQYFKLFNGQSATCPSYSSPSTATLPSPTKLVLDLRHLRLSIYPAPWPTFKSQDWTAPSHSPKHEVRRRLEPQWFCIFDVLLFVFMITQSRELCRGLAPWRKDTMNLSMSSQGRVDLNGLGPSCFLILSFFLCVLYFTLLNAIFRPLFLAFFLSFFSVLPLHTTSSGLSFKAFMYGNKPPQRK